MVVPAYGMVISTFYVFYLYFYIHFTSKGKTLCAEVVSCKHGLTSHTFYTSNQFRSMVAFQQLFQNLLLQLVALSRYCPTKPLRHSCSFTTISFNVDSSVTALS